MRALSSALVVFSLVHAAPLRAETVRIDPGVSAPAGGAEWALAGPRQATATKHALAPVVRVDAGAPVLEVALPGVGNLRMVPTGISSRAEATMASRVRRGAAASRVEPVRSLPSGTRILVVSDASQRQRRAELLVKDAWTGVDERFLLRGSAVKHDLLLSRDAVAALGTGDIVAEWILELPAGVTALPDLEGPARGITFIDAERAFLARIPAPLVRDADDPHPSAGQARFELLRRSSAPVLRLVVSGAWARAADRAYPLELDPTVDLQPTGAPKTGFVDEFGNQNLTEINSGSLLLAGYGAEVRGFAEFPLDVIPDGATINDVRLEVWLNNHDNPGNPALPLPMWIKHCAVPASDTPLNIHAAIGPLGTGRVYVNQVVTRTGDEFCPEFYEFREYDLGPLADADVAAQLPSDFLTVGFTSEVRDDPDFDHIDYMGYIEFVDNPFCMDGNFPGSRITLVVDYEEPNAPPVCSAGGPYVSDCPSTPILISASASFDPDGDPLTFSWTSDCSGTIENPLLSDAILHLDPSCGEACTVTVAVSDAFETVTCSASVTAQDLLPPDVTSSDLEGLCLWPPRHDLFCLGLASGHVVVEDTCGSAAVRWIGCTSDQPDEAPDPGEPENGDGNFDEDCQVSADRTEMCIRVERAGSDPVDGHNTFDGRHYGVAVEVDDGCGNVVIVPGNVFVPHDRRGGSGGQLDPCVGGGGTR